MINHFHAVRKHMLDHKAFGCFRHRNIAPTSPYLRGFSDDFVIPVSRWTEMKQAEIDAAIPSHAKVEEGRKDIPLSQGDQVELLHHRPFRELVEGKDDQGGE